MNNPYLIGYKDASLGKVPAMLFANENPDYYLGYNSGFEALRKHTRQMYALYIALGLWQFGTLAVAFLCQSYLFTFIGFCILVFIFLFPKWVDKNYRMRIIRLR